jgi:obg-like ATPase 1
VVHTEGEVNPINDMITITNELRLKDVDRLEGIIAEKKKNRLMDKSKKLELEVLETILEFLNSGQWISHGTLYLKLLLFCC